MPHVPVLTSANLSTATRIILYIGESSQDLGIFAYRTVGQESIAGGSAIDFVTHAQATRDEPAIVIANMGQLIWYRRGRQAMTEPTFQAIPRPTAVSSALVRDGKKNLIPGSEGLPQHVATVFEEVLGKLASKEAKIDVIGIGDGALEVVEYLQKEWGRWADKVVAVAVGASYIWRMEFWDNNFKDFWGKVNFDRVQSTLLYIIDRTDCLLARPSLSRFPRVAGHSSHRPRWLRLQLLFRWGTPLP